MPQLDPSLSVPVVYPRPVTGFRRQVQIEHPSFPLPLGVLTTDSSINESLNPSFTEYAYTPATGPKQKSVHAAGTKEITWNISGEVTNSSFYLLNLMDSNNRGVNLSTLWIHQGADSYLFSNPNGYSLPWASFSLNGNPNSALAFSLEGRSTRPVTSGAGTGWVAPDVQIPSWYTGNDFVLSWTLTHSVNLVAKWYNTNSMLPSYYRVGKSEYTIRVTTSVVLTQHTGIRIGFGSISLFEGVVTSRNRVFGHKNAPVTYEVNSTNARIQDQDEYIPFVNIFLFGGPANSSYN